MPKIKRAISVLFVMFYSVLATFGQKQERHASDYTLTQYTSENGLPQNSIKSMVSDENGFIWLATEAGLTRFNGWSFTNFDSLQESYSNKGIAGFYQCPNDACKGKILSVNTEGSLAYIKEGKVFLSGDLNEAGLLKGKAGGINPTKTYIATGTPGLYWRHKRVNNYVVLRGEDKYFYCTKDSVVHFTNQKITSRYRFVNQGFEQFFRINNALYHLDEHGQLFRFSDMDITSQAKNAMFADKRIQLVVQNNKRYQIFWNNVCDQVFIQVDDSLFLLSQDASGNIESTLILDGFDFENNFIKTIYYDQAAKRIFLGSQIRGLYVYNLKMFKTVTAQVPGTDNVFYAQTVYSKDQILSNQGILFNTQKKLSQPLYRQLKLISSNTDWDKTSMLTDTRGCIWTKNDTLLYRYNATGDSVTGRWKLPSGILRLHQGLDRKIWIGTTDKGLFRLDADKAGSFPVRVTKFPFSRITWILSESSDVIWVGTGRGLYKINLAQKKIASVTALKDKYIRSLAVLGNDQIWITTYSDGVYLLRDNRLTRFPDDTRKYLASAHCIIEDNKGFLWITTNNGLFQVAKKDLLDYVQKPFRIYYQFYSKSMGFISNEFNGGCEPCAVQTPTGMISLPSMEGLVWFNPENVIAEQPKGKIFFENLIISNVPSFIVNNSIKLAGRTDQISLGINTLNFGDPSNLEIYYSLQKKGENRSDWFLLDSKEPKVIIPQLASGNYTLSIRKSNGFGAGNFETNTLMIRVGREWYETWWFLAICFMLLSILVLAIFKLKDKTVQREKRLLEARVSERTKHLENTIGQLSQTENELGEQARAHIRMIASIAHDVRNPIKYLSSAMTYVQQLIQTGELETAVQTSQNIGQASDQIYRLIDNMLIVMKSEIHGIHNHFTRTDLRLLVIEKAGLFENANECRIKIHVTPDSFVHTNQNLLGIIVHNIIDNAVKAKVGNEIDIYTDTEDTRLCLIISDKGPGLPAELISWFNNEENVVLPGHYQGLGLIMIKEIARMLDIMVFAGNDSVTSINLLFKSEDYLLINS